MNQKGIFTRCMYGWVLFACGCTLARAETQVGVDVGFRNDELNWSIPGEFKGQDNNIYQTNIVSELTWKNVRSNYINGHAIFKDGQFVVRGDMGFGIISSGDNQDSDYRGNNRTEEFSRSNNKSNGKDVNDIKIAVGLNFALMVNEATGAALHVTPLVGLSSHVQSFRMTNLRQTVSEPLYAPFGINPPPLGSYSGLNSSYATRWNGPWVGINALYPLDPKISLRVDFEHHRADYYAKANWNLRDDLAHPKSYTHSASGDGNVGRLGVDVALSDQMKLILSVTSQEWTTGTGTDHFYFSNGRSEYGLLNKVTWRSQSYLLGLEVPL